VGHGSGDGGDAETPGDGLGTCLRLQESTGFVSAATGSGFQRNVGSILPPHTHLGGREYLPVKNAMRFTFKRVWHFLQTTSFVNTNGPLIS
jgi:hypothetical protein